MWLYIYVLNVWPCCDVHHHVAQLLCGVQFQLNPLHWLIYDQVEYIRSYEMLTKISAVQYMFKEWFLWYFGKTYFDIRVFNPHAPPPQHFSQPAVAIEETRLWESVSEVEHTSLTPLVNGQWSLGHSTRDLSLTWPQSVTTYTIPLCPCYFAVCHWLPPSYNQPSSAPRALAPAGVLQQGHLPSPNPH